MKYKTIPKQKGRWFLLLRHYETVQNSHLSFFFRKFFNVSISPLQFFKSSLQQEGSQKIPIIPPSDFLGLCDCCSKTFIIFLILGFPNTYPPILHYPSFSNTGVSPVLCDFFLICFYRSHPSTFIKK